MIKVKYKKHVIKSSIGSHPKYIQKRLLSLNKNQFGYNAFGLKENTNRDLYDYLKGYKEKYFDLNFMV